MIKLNKHKPNTPHTWNAKSLSVRALEVIFFIIVFVILMINFYKAGSIFLYNDNHDHHLAFFTYLGGMAANGILPGIDFYSPHSIFIPIVMGFFFKFLGIGQISLGIADGILIFITFIFIYKTARLVMPRSFAMFAVFAMLLNHTGHDNPWFNDVIMCFVAIGVYFFAAYIDDRKPYRLIIIGLICFSLPYFRQQGFVLSAVILSLPVAMFYLSMINRNEYTIMLKKILSTFIIANLIFWLFIIIRNGFEGIEILFSSLTSLVDMAQPAIGYENTPLKIASIMLNYTEVGLDWHGYSVKLLSYWFIVILPCCYFAFRPLNLYASKKEIVNADTIRFVVAIVTLSTIIFNYPINEDARMRVQFGIGIWLFVESLRLGFYNKHIKILSILAIGIVFLLLNHSKIAVLIEDTKNNYIAMTTTRNGYYKMPSNTPYAGMRFQEKYASHLQKLLADIESYHTKYPQKLIIFDGELVDINAYLLLLFSGPEVGLQHKFPYSYGVFDRKKFFPQIDEKFDEFITQNKPIIIGCKNLNDETITIPKDYRILSEINDKCVILVDIQ